MREPLPQATRVLLVDDHPLVAGGIAALLAQSEFELVATLSRGEEVLPAVEEYSPDIIILDDRLPGMHGLEVFRALRARGDRTPVIILTGTMPEQRTLECVEAGVEGLVLKQTDATLLLTCLAEVKQGRRWIDQTVLQNALNRATGSRGDDGPLATLSAREREIVQLVGENLRTRAIAEQLGISEGTVKVHLHNAYQKLGVSSRIEIVLMMRGLD